MTDEAGAAPAASEPVAAPAAEPAAQPAQSGSDGDSAPPPSDRWKERPGNSIDRAFAQLDKADKTATEPAAKTDKTAQPTATGERARDESGRFVAKDQTQPLPGMVTPSQPEAKASTEQKPQQTTAFEPPARFSADAKAVWKDAHPAIQGEVSRAFRELETGIAQYRQQLEPLKPYFELAQQHGVTVDRAMAQYVAFEQALVSRDPGQKLAAIEDLLGIAGIGPREYAAHVLGQPADQAHSQAESTIRELQRVNAQQARELAGFKAATQASHENEAKKQVDEFAKAHPRLLDDSFASVVARVIESKLAENLADAYEIAERLKPAAADGVNPVAQPSNGNAAQPKPTPAQPGKGQLSITGAPSSGSNPANRKPPATAKEALDRSFAALGLG